MNNQIVYNLYYAFAERGFSVLRFNFRGVGRSQGEFDHGAGELSDAAAALDWAADDQPGGARLLDRRRLVRLLDRHAAADAPPGDRGLHLDRPAGEPLYDFSFLAPCPSSGLFVHGDKDRVAPLKEVQALIEKLKTQKGILIEHAVIPGANHFFENCVDTADRRGRHLSRPAPRQPRAHRDARPAASGDAEREPPAPQGSGAGVERPRP